MSNTISIADAMKDFKKDNPPLEEAVQQEMEAAKIEPVVSEEIKKEIEKEATQVEIPKTVLKSKVTVDPTTRAFDQIQVFLDQWAKMPANDPKKSDILINVVRLIQKQPKKIILDSLLEFFRLNRNKEFIDPAHALQSTQNLAPVDSIRVRILYGIMYKLSHNQATRENINLETIRSIFRSDDLTNWVAVQIETRAFSAK